MFIYNNTPKLDLHGEIVSMVEVLVNDFIEETFGERRKDDKETEE